MITLGYPDNFQQRAVHQRTNQKTTSNETVYSDASLIVLTNQYKPNIEIKFVDIYPTSLSTLDFNVQESDIEYLTGTASFAYRKYELNILR
jgi:hypothetical protein